MNVPETGLINPFKVELKDDTAKIWIKPGYGNVNKKKLASLVAIAVELNDNTPPNIEIWEGDNLRVKFSAEFVPKLIQDSE